MHFSLQSDFQSGDKVIETHLPTPVSGVQDTFVKVNTGNINYSRFLSSEEEENWKGKMVCP